MGCGTLRRIDGVSVAAVENQDVVQAVLNASSALAGFVLVFLGLIVNTLQSYDSGTPEAVTKGYRLLATMAGGAFLFGVMALSLCMWWLAGYQDSAVRWLAVGALVTQLVLLVVSAVAVLVVFVWTDQ